MRWVSTEERGSVTLWVIGLCLMLLMVGGLGVDLWRSFSDRRALAAIADSAALAGASAIDADAYRATGALVLIPAEAELRARRSVAQQTDRRALRTVEVVAEPGSVAVVVRGKVRLTLLRLVQRGDFDVSVTALASPRRSGS